MNVGNNFGLGSERVAIVTSRETRARASRLQSFLNHRERCVTRSVAHTRSKHVTAADGNLGAQTVIVSEPVAGCFVAKLCDKGARLFREIDYPTAQEQTKVGKPGDKIHRKSARRARHLIAQAFKD